MYSVTIVNTQRPDRSDVTHWYDFHDALSQLRLLTDSYHNPNKDRLHAARGFRPYVVQYKGKIYMLTYVPDER